MSNNETVKNWLIRTKQKQVLGPVTKNKILELISKGSLAPDDELASGNGYWFSVKEADLMEKYVNGDVPQGFNPISEAPTVVATAENPEATVSINPRPRKEVVEELENTPVGDDADYPDDNAPGSIPSGEDADYPDMPETQAPPSVEASSEEEDADEEDDDEELQGAVPSADDLEYPDMEAITASVSSTPSTPSPPKYDFSEPVEETPVVEEASAPSPEPAAAELSPADVEGEGVEGKMPNDEDLEYPDMPGGAPVAAAAAAAPASELEASIEEDAEEFSLDLDEVEIPEEEEELSLDPVVEESAEAPAVEETVEEASEDISLSLDEPEAPAVEEEALSLDDPEPMAEESLSLDEPEPEPEPEPVPEPMPEPEPEPEPVEVKEPPKPVAKKKKKKKKKKVAKSAGVRRKKSGEKTKRIRMRRKVEPPAQGSDRYLLLILMFLVVMVIGLLYVYKKVLNKPLPLVGQASISFIMPSAVAQVPEESLTKKKS